jgi:lipoprotein-releasing system ATP-binding protein
MSEIVLHCQELEKTFHQGRLNLTVLKGISFSIYKGESVAIVGSSGSGKSTLLNLLGGLDKATQGYVELLGNRYEKLKEAQLSALRNRELGFVYQFHHLLSEFDALENTAMPLLIRGISSKQAKREAEQILEKVGLKERLYHRPSELSGGERQRVAIARALVAKPSCVLMDEPTGNLDEKTASHIQSLLQELNDELGICFVLVTHDKKIALQQKRILSLHEGLLSEFNKDEWL